MLTHCAADEGSLDFFQSFYWAPALCNEAAMGHVQVEHVHGMVDALDLGHLRVGSNAITTEHLHLT